MKEMNENPSGCRMLLAVQTPASQISLSLLRSTVFGKWFNLWSFIRLWVLIKIIIIKEIFWSQWLSVRLPKSPRVSPAQLLLFECTGPLTAPDPFLSLPAPNYDKSCWFDEKPTLGMEFPNVSMTYVCARMLKCAVTALAVTGIVIYIWLQLPYLEDGDRKIVQSNAIMRYIARKHNLCKWRLFLFSCPL